MGGDGEYALSREMLRERWEMRRVSETGLVMAVLCVESSDKPTCISLTPGCSQRYMKFTVVVNIGSTFCRRT
jgi:hypothetical protein